MGVLVCLLLSYAIEGLFKCVSKRRNSLVIRIVNHGHFSKEVFLYRACKCFPRGYRSSAARQTLPKLMTFPKH